MYTIGTISPFMVKLLNVAHATHGLRVMEIVKDYNFGNEFQLDWIANERCD